MTEIRQLSWGRRYLMCRPEHFRVDYAINPWMDVDSPVDPDRALAQWDQLVATIESAGAVVERIAQLPDAPDMVYAMNLGFVVEPAEGPFETPRPSAPQDKRWAMRSSR